MVLLLQVAGTAPSSSKGKTLSMPVRRVVCGGSGEHAQAGLTNPNTHAAAAQRLDDDDE